jgi:hypothetical protein
MIRMFPFLFLSALRVVAGVAPLTQNRNSKKTNDLCLNRIFFRGLLIAISPLLPSFSQCGDPKAGLRSSDSVLIKYDNVDGF